MQHPASELRLPTALEEGDIYVMNSDGSGLTKLTDDPAYDAFPAWRP
jgi:Tol biopolymer transport system component